MLNDGACSYDDVPYASLAFAQTHPDRLATIGRMFGLPTVAVGHCRVLELGCADGGNLIPMAANLPQSEFVGIDLSRGHVETAQSAIGSLGLRNVRIVQGSIDDIDAGWGTFDYIICHGVYSWVDPGVQDAILRAAASNLAEHGIAYISYNTYPGWHMREMVRHMMRYHAGRFEEPAEQIEQARALLDFVASASDGEGPYSQLLNREVERLSHASDSYLYHEHLERTNTPLYFHQFIERAEAAGLQYLAEADVSNMLTSLLPPAVAETLDEISPDILHLEQYMDFVRNRQFRQTLLCHARHRPNRAISPAFMRGLSIASSALPDSLPVELSPDTTVVFSKGAQRATVALPATKAALTLLMEAWPEAIDVAQLSRTALERAAPFLGDTPIRAARQSLMSDLLACVTHGVVQLHTTPPQCIATVSGTPLANVVAAHQARSGSVVVNAHHHMVEFEPFVLEVLKLADGQRRRADIVDVLVQRHAAGEVAIELEGSPVADTEQAHAILVDKVDKAIASLIRGAVLVS